MLVVSIPGSGQAAARPRLFIRIPARPRAVALSAAPITATQPVSALPATVAVVPPTSYDPDFLENSTDPSVIPPGRNLYPLARRKLYDSWWRAGLFDRLPYGWFPQSEWTLHQINFWPALHDIRIGTALPLRVLEVPSPLLTPVTRGTPPLVALSDQRETSSSSTPSCEFQIFTLLSVRLTDIYKLPMIGYCRQVATHSTTLDGEHLRRS